MRFVAAAALAALALAACNQNSASTTAQNDTAATQSSGGGVFPDLGNAHYRIEATMTRADRSLPMVMTRDGAKMRVDTNVDGNSQTMIINPETHQALMIMSRGGQQMAMRMDESAFPDVTRDWNGRAQAEVRRAGDCALAGEHGSVWEHTDADGKNTRTVCVTNDGIPLRITNNGATMMETTSVQRGAQAANLFEAPPGVRVMDVSGLSAQANAMAARLRAQQNGQAGQ